MIPEEACLLHGTLSWCLRAREHWQSCRWHMPEMFSTAGLQDSHHDLLVLKGEWGNGS